MDLKSTHPYTTASSIMIKFIRNERSIVNMFDKIQKTIMHGLRGTHIHMDPLKALDGLNADTAKLVPMNGKFSCWQILYHIVYWQDLMLTHLREEKASWPKNNEASWPDNDSLGGEDAWLDLVSRFKKGIEEAEVLTKNIDSFDNLPTPPEVPAYAALSVFTQHNAYHIGQLVATRQALGAWPPPNYKPTY